MEKMKRNRDVLMDLWESIPVSISWTNPSDVVRTHRRNDCMLPTENWQPTESFEDIPAPSGTELRIIPRLALTLYPGYSDSRIYAHHHHTKKIMAWAHESTLLILWYNFKKEE